jgi:hypothetical protein
MSKCLYCACEYVRVSVLSARMEVGMSERSLWRAFSILEPPDTLASRT